MDRQRRNFINVTAAGLIHIAACPFKAASGGGDANVSASTDA